MCRAAELVRVLFVRVLFVRVVFVGALFVGTCLNATFAQQACAQEPPAPIEVVAESSPRTPIDDAVDPTPAVYVLQRDALSASGLTSAEALARVPGVEVTRSGGPADLATATIRGASSAQTPIYLAGVRLNDDLTGTLDLSSLPLWLLDRVVVYRGHAPRGADRFAIGGAVYFEPRLPKMRPGARRLHGGLGLGSFGWREGRAAFAIGGPGAAALLAVRHSAAVGNFSYLDDGGTRFDARDDVTRRRNNAHHRESDVWAIGRVRNPRGGLTMFGNAFARDGGAPGLQLNGANHTSISLRRNVVGLRARAVCGPAEDQCTLELVSSGLITRYRLSDPLSEVGLARAVSNAGERWAQRIRLQTRVNDWLEFGLGGSHELALVRIDSDGNRTTNASRSLLRSELDVVIQPHERIHVALIGAFECHSFASRGGDEACAVREPLARIGLAAQLVGPLSAKANVGRYVRVPTLGELHGISSVLRGNADLVPEDGITVDAGLSVQGKVSELGGYAQVFGFVRWADALIAYRRSSLGIVRPYNSGSARVLGVEVAAGATLWGALNLGGTLTISDPRDTSDDTLASDLLPLHSRFVAAPYLGLTVPEAWRSSYWNASIPGRYLHRGSRVADPAGLPFARLRRSGRIVRGRFPSQPHRFVESGFAASPRLLRERTGGPGGHPTSRRR